MINQMSSSQIQKINADTEWKRSGGEQAECFVSGAVFLGIVGLVLLVAWVVLSNWRMA